MLFFKKKEKKKQEERLPLTQGMSIEVLTMDNKLTFVGKVQSYNGTELEIVEANGQEVPPVLYNSEVKLRGFKSGIQPIVLHGKICGGNNTMWKLYDLELYVIQREKMRMFIRQSVSINAQAARVPVGFMPTVRSSSVADSAQKCRIMDIGGGGALINSRERYAVGDWIYLMDVKLLPNEAPFNFSCRIVRMQEENSYSFNYGCQFEKMDTREEDRLTQAIFAIQRMDVQTQRDRS